MKKIRFGSFPLVEIPKKERRCLDRYLIKNFSDNISISDAMRNLNVTKNLLYVSPDYLIKHFMDGANTPSISQPDQSKSPDSKAYDLSLKRAFFIMKEFYKNIKNKPFYKEYVYYPIYVEKIDVQRSTMYGKITEPGSGKMIKEYSFIILSNDLDTTLKIDEIRYDENATLNFLYLYSEFFADPKYATKSLNDLDHTDLNFLMKLYQYIEKSEVSPIELVLKLYSFLNQLTPGSTFTTTTDITAAFKKGVDMPDLKKYNGVLKSTFFRSLQSTNGIYSNEQARESFIKMLDALFKEKGFIDLFGEIQSDKIIDRQQYIYNANKYKEIIGLVEELVKFNRSNDAHSIIQDDQIDFDFKIQNDHYQVEVRDKRIAEVFTSRFKDLIEQSKTFVKNELKLVINKLKNQFQNDLSNEKGLMYLEKERDGFQKERQAILGLKRQIHNELIKLSSSNDPDDIRHRNELITKYGQLDNEQHALETSIDHIDKEININKYLFQQSNGIIEALKDDKNIVDIADSIMSDSVTDYTYLFEDLFSIFKTRTLVEQQMEVELTNGDFLKLSANLPEDKTELAEVYRAIADDIDQISDQVKERLRGIMINLVGQYTDKFDKIIENYKSDKAGKPGFQPKKFKNLLMSFINDLDEPDYQEQFKARYKNILTTGSKNIITLIIKKEFQRTQVHQEISKNDKLSELHPLIKKLLQEPQNFRSYILDFKILENLYQLWFITQTKKFGLGLVKTLPRKLNHPKNRIEFTIETILGLKKNPVWILADQKIYLSMPDYLSLTGVKILSSVPKEEILEVCKIKGRDYWNENNIGTSDKVYEHKKDEELAAKVEELKVEIKDLQSQKNKTTDKNKIKQIDSKLKSAKKHLVVANNKLKKVRQQKVLNRSNIQAFDLFDDPHMSDKTTLLTPAEKDAIRDKEETLMKEEFKPGVQLPGVDIQEPSPSNQSTVFGATQEDIFKKRDNRVQF